MFIHQYLTWLILYITLNHAKGISLSRLISKYDPSVINIIERDGKIYVKKENVINSRNIFENLKTNVDLEKIPNDNKQKNLILHIMRQLKNPQLQYHREIMTNPRIKEDDTIFRPMANIINRLRNLDGGFIDKTFNNDRYETQKEEEFENGNEISSQDLNEITLLVRKIKKFIRKSSPKLKLKTLNVLTRLIEALEGDSLSDPYSSSDAYKVVRGNTDTKIVVDTSQGTGSIKLAPTHNHFYDYWTYEHPKVYSDQCPKNQVMIGHVCSYMPPHR